MYANGARKLSRAVDLPQIRGRFNAKRSPADLPRRTQLLLPSTRVQAWATSGDLLSFSHAQSTLQTTAPASGAFGKCILYDLCSAGFFPLSDGCALVRARVFRP
jgi:hypothetical protein